MLPARAAIAAFVALSLSIRLVATPEPAGSRAAVAFERGHDSLAVVRARINGSDPLRFLIDTGSSASAVSTHVASKLHLPDAGVSPLAAIAGSQPRRVVRVEELSIGTFTLRRLMPSVLDDAHLGALGAGVDGVLGEDALGDATYTVDYRRGEITWDAALPADQRIAATLALEPTERGWLAALPQDSTRQFSNLAPLRLVPDSGASAFVFFDRGRALPVDWRPDGAPVPIATALGLRLGWPVRVRTLAIGSIILRDQPATVIPRHEPDAPMGDGLLPLNAFARATFDAHARTLTLFVR